MLTFLNQSESLYRNFTVHRCKFKKCYFCFKYKQKTQYGNIICENTQEKLHQCEKCNKKTFDSDCYRRHKNLSSYDCQIIKDCQKCQTRYRGREIDHICDSVKCQICFTFHSKNVLCHLKERKIQRKIKSKIHLIGLKTSNTILISHIQETTHHFIYLFNLHSKNLLIYELNSGVGIYTLIANQDFFGTSFFDCMDILEISNLAPEIHVDNELFDFLEEENMKNCTLIQINKQISVLKFKFLTIKRLELHCCYNVIDLWQRLQLRELQNPYLVFYVSCAEEHGMESLNINCYLENITSTNKDYFNSLESNQQYLVYINKMSQDSYINQHLLYRLKIITSYFIKVNQIPVKIFGQYEKSILDSSTFSQFSQDIFLKTFTNFNLPALTTNEDKSFYTTSQYEIAFAKAFLNIHKCNRKSIYSYVHNQGQQFKIGHLTSDISCVECEESYFIEGLFKYICPIHKIRENNKAEIMKRHLNGIQKRRRFQHLSGHKILVIGTCCIKKNEYVDFGTSKTFTKAMGDFAFHYLQSFNKEKHKRLNFR